MWVETQNESIEICDTLEDKVRELGCEQDKVYAETAIPAGTYRVILTWSPHFKCYMPELLDVPYFKNVRIHWGNDPEDTKGCILVGENKQRGKVLNSKKAYKRLMQVLMPHFNQKEEVYINISD